MRCERFKPMMNDLLDKTLSHEEERELEGHLAVCESCRCEFQGLKRADGILREVVREMVSEIEVPPELSRRIETILAGEQRKRLLGRLPAFLKTPAVAAVLLLAVLTAGILSFYNPFIAGVKQADVALTEPQGENTVQGSGPALALKDSPAAVEPVTPKETPKESKTYTVLDKAASGDSGKEPEKKLEEHSLSPIAAQASRSSPKAYLYEGKSTVTSTGGPFLKSGTLEEAAREVGFNPAKPAYLPQGTELQEVTWLPGVVNQNYRDGQVSIIVSQSRADTVRFESNEGDRQGTAAEINDTKAALQQSGPVTGGNVTPGYNTVRWQRGEWIFSVSGELPRDEIIKIASSLK